jgi:hypothetical protein
VLKFNSSDGGWAGVSIGDFNGDGRKDLVVNSREYTDSPAISLFAQDASGQIVGPSNLRTASTPDAMVAADMNRDGRDDLLVIHVVNSAMGYYQQGAQGLSTEVKYWIPSTQTYQANALTTGDINHDGIRDAITATAGGQSLLLLYGTGRRTGIRVNDSSPRVPRKPSGATPPSGAHSASGAPAVNDSLRSDTAETGVDAPGIGWRSSRWIRQWRVFLRTAQANVRGVGLRAAFATLLDRSLSWENSSHTWLRLIAPAHPQKEAGRLAAAASVAAIPVHRSDAMGENHGGSLRRICQRSP